MGGDRHRGRGDPHRGIRTTWGGGIRTESSRLAGPRHPHPPPHRARPAPPPAVSPVDCAAAAAANLGWVEDCASHLLAVLALDRFGDYLSDQVGVGGGGIGAGRGLGTPA